MKKFNLLSRAEMKKVMGGNLDDESIDGEGGGGGDADANVKACAGKSEGSSCSYKGSSGSTLYGNCVKGTWTSLYCNIPG